MNVGQKPRVRIHGVLKILDSESIVTRELINEFIAGVFSDTQREDLAVSKETHRAYEQGGARFRLNAFYENDQPALVARLIQSRIPSPEEIGLPETILRLASADRGLLLVTGPTGSGKSTTLASIIDWMNQTTAKNIVTLEDPIEYQFVSQRSLIKQREVGRDIPSFQESLKHIVRHDPNVIMIGEMRDTETMRAAITLAETGHLVISTLHTSSAHQTINRIIDSFPSEQHAQIRSQLSLSLLGIVTQKLLPASDGTRVAVREVLVNTPAIAHLIREYKLEQMPSVMQTSTREGMIPLAHALQALYLEGKISHDILNEHTAAGN